VDRARAIERVALDVAILSLRAARNASAAAIDVLATPVV
jgi:hypothetical protein